MIGPTIMSEKPISVLLNEDNPADARLIRELLDEEPGERFELTHATELETGLDRLAHKDIDVVLLDLSLPDSQGIATFNKMNMYAPHMHIVVLTGLKDDLIAAQTLRAGG
jgi:DNA-binding NarL/FixJ family response regulator